MHGSATTPGDVPAATRAAASAAPIAESAVHSVRVRYAETDQMGVAHHAAYVAWLEEARIAWLRQRQISYRDLEASGCLLPVIDLSIRYRKPLRFDDEITLHTTATAIGPTRLVFATRILLTATLCAEATVTVAAVDRCGKPMRLPMRC